MADAAANNSSPVRSVGFVSWDWEAKNRDRIGVEVKKFLDETEAATVDTVCRRFGFSKSYLQMKFPDLHDDITARYWRRVHLRRAKRRQILSQETLNIVAQSIPSACARLWNAFFPCSATTRQKIGNS